MGFSLSWIGVRGKSPESVLADLGYRRTGEQEEVPESPAVCAVLGTGWFIVALNNSADAYDGTIDPAPLSRGAEVVTCMVEEHVMVSGFSSWKDGSQLLAVGHDAERGIRHLVMEGTLPPELQQIVDDAMRSQEREDAGDAATDFVFDIPVEMAYRLTGFRHDSAPDGDDPAFEVLERQSRPGRTKRSWLSGLLGRRAR